MLLQLKIGIRYILGRYQYQAYNKYEATADRKKNVTIRDLLTSLIAYMCCGLYGVIPMYLFTERGLVTLVIEILKVSHNLMNKKIPLIVLVSFLGPALIDSLITFNSLYIINTKACNHKGILLVI